MGKGRVAVGLSGGVDSSVAAFLLKEHGFDVVGVSLNLLKDGKSDVGEKAAKVAKKLGIEHHVLDVSDFFEQTVIKNFNESYLCGKTPNPCVMCNRLVKWGKMFDVARENFGAEFFATGHYADVRRKNGKSLLFPAKDTHKDQLYFLFNIPQNLLEKTIFPLAEFSSKAEIREIAAQNDLPSKSAKDSQDICFIQKPMTFSKYAESVLKPEEGDFIMNSTGKRVGKHFGAARFTPGQRKGLGIAYKEPLYVVRTDVAENKVYIGTRDELFYDTVIVNDLNMHDLEVGDEFFALVKIRYNMNAVPAKVRIDGGFAKITFETPVSAPAKGQAAVFYDENDGHLTGGGFIFGAERGDKR